MESRRGTISDKIRRLLSTDEILKSAHPDRGASPKGGPIPMGTNGHQLSKPNRKAKGK